MWYISIKSGTAARPSTERAWQNAFWPGSSITFGARLNIGSISSHFGEPCVMPKESDFSPRITAHAQLRVEDVARYAEGSGPTPCLDRSGGLEARVRANRLFLENKIKSGAD